jgi:Major Facilitator Superfamily
MVAALMLPRLLDRFADRAVMLPAATGLGIILVGFAVVTSFPNFAWPALSIAWTLLGIGYSAVMTPSGRLLRRSAQPADRPAVFAAQFALSHACWLLTYPLAGWLGASAGIVPTSSVLAALTFAGVLIAWQFWPADDPEVILHHHPELPPDPSPSPQRANSARACLRHRSSASSLAVSSLGVTCRDFQKSSLSWIASRPALAQASSASPPGAPDTPTAPTSEPPASTVSPPPIMTAPGKFRMPACIMPG